MTKHRKSFNTKRLHKRRHQVLFLLLICLFLLLACGLPGSFQARVMRTPLPLVVTVTPQPLPTPSLTAVIPAAPSPQLLEREQFRLRSGIEYARNSAHPEQDCFWLGVGGQVLDVNGTPLEGVVVVVEGLLKEEPVEALGLTGATDAYGENAYEVFITYLPVHSAQALSATLYDLDGKQLSNPVHFNTYADCTRNLVKITFQQVP